MDVTGARAWLACEGAELVSADLDGELDAAERAALAAHLRTCPSCPAAARRLATTMRRLRVSGTAAVPDLTRTILARLAQPERRVRKLPGGSPSS